MSFVDFKKLMRTLRLRILFSKSFQVESAKNKKNSNELHSVNSCDNELMFAETVIFNFVLLVLFIYLFV